MSGVHTGPGATTFARMRASDDLLGEALGERHDRALRRGLPDVDPSERAHGLVDDALACIGLGEIGGEEDRLASGLLDDALGRLRVVVLVQVRDRDVGALPRERERDRATDAAVGAGHERHTAGEPAIPLVRALAASSSSERFSRRRNPASGAWITDLSGSGR